MCAFYLNAKDTEYYVIHEWNIYTAVVIVQAMQIPNENKIEKNIIND